MVTDMFKEMTLAEEQAAFQRDLDFDRLIADGLARYENPTVEQILEAISSAAAAMNPDRVEGELTYTYDDEYRN
jgi:hypothetical protein